MFKINVVYSTCLFCLLISQMRSAPVKRDISIDLPQETTTLKPLNLPKNLVVVKRASNQRYFDDDDYDDSDYAGYDRRGAAVGYQDRDDDFPTVVW